MGLGFGAVTDWRWVQAVDNLVSDVAQLEQAQPLWLAPIRCAITATQQQVVPKPTRACTQAGPAVLVMITYES